MEWETFTYEIVYDLTEMEIGCILRILQGFFLVGS